MNEFIEQVYYDTDKGELEFDGIDGNYPVYRDFWHFNYDFVGVLVVL